MTLKKLTVIGLLLIMFALAIAVGFSSHLSIAEIKDVFIYLLLTVGGIADIDVKIGKK